MTIALANTYDAIGNREDLEEVISNIAPLEAPFYASMPKVSISSTKHEWLTDTLSAAAKNAVAENKAWEATAQNVRVRIYNYSQIFYKAPEVTYTQDVVDKAGVDSEMAYQKQIALKELARDIEYSLMNGTGASGASGTARELSGVITFIATNEVTASATGSPLIESLLTDTLQKCWDAGSQATDIYVNAFQKRKIDSFKSTSGRYVTQGTTINTMIDLYESSFGAVTVVLDRYVPASVVLAMNKALWSIGTLQRITSEDLSVSGLTHRSQIFTQLTLISRNEKGNAKITGLTTS